MDNLITRSYVSRVLDSTAAGTGTNYGTPTSLADVRSITYVALLGTATTGTSVVLTPQVGATTAAFTG